MVDTRLARGYLPQVQQTTVEVGAQPHSRAGGRQLTAVQPLSSNELLHKHKQT